jgi:hypothetical protein
LKRSVIDPEHRRLAEVERLLQACLLECSRLWF